jgi:hypothetical protein
MVIYLALVGPAQSRGNVSLPLLHGFRGKSSCGRPSLPQPEGGVATYPPLLANLAGHVEATLHLLKVPTLRMLESPDLVNWH